MKLSATQRRILLSVQYEQGRDEGARAGRAGWNAGIKEGSALASLKRLERRGLVKALPRDNPNDEPYSTWNTRWQLTRAGAEALS